MAITKENFRKRKIEIANTQDSHQKITLMLSLAFDILYQNQINDAQTLFDNAEELSIKMDFKEELGRINMGRSVVAYFASEHEAAAHFSNKAIELFTETNSKNYLAETYTNLGISHWSQGSYSKALHLIFKSMHLYQSIGETEKIAYTFYMLGNFYLDLSDPDNAEQNFLRAQTAAATGDIYSVINSRSWIGLANVALQRTQYPRTSEYLNYALEIQTQMDDTFGMSRTFNDLAKMYRKTGQIGKAYEYYSKSLSIRLEASDQQALVTTYLDLGEFSLEQKKYDIALSYLQHGLKIATKLQARVKLYRGHLLISQVYEIKQEFTKAYEHLKLHNLVKEEVMGKDANLKIRNLEINFAKEHSEKEAEIYRLKNVELKKLYEEIEYKNQEITDSIEYARHIQDAMLPLKSDMLAYKEQAFILYKPRDIVSGDFYWFTNIPHQADASKNLVFIAAVDCTGHGVPGAFMSMIGNNLLDNIIKEWKISNPEEILKYMHIGVRKALKQEQTDNQDGMDIALIVIDEVNQCLHFAGANNPLVYVQNNELQLIKGNKHGIGGGNYSPNRTFDQYTISFKNTPTVFYIFSDGFQDQFGGLENKKYMKPRFRQLLFNIHHHPLPKQYQILDSTLKEWMNDEPQIDDILVMGIKVGDSPV